MTGTYDCIPLVSISGVVMLFLLCLVDYVLGRRQEPKIKKTELQMHQVKQSPNDLQIFVVCMLCPSSVLGARNITTNTIKHLSSWRLYSSGEKGHTRTHTNTHTPAHTPRTHAHAHAHTHTQYKSISKARC